MHPWKQPLQYCLNIILSAALCLQNISPAFAQTSPGHAGSTGTFPEQITALTSEFKGLVINPSQPLSLRLLILPGKTSAPANLSSESLAFAKYFLSALSLPDEDLWVNLSPAEPDRIITPSAGKTSLGQELLVQDYFLKQLTSSLMNPEGETGKQFWDRVYLKIYDAGARRAVTAQRNDDHSVRSHGRVPLQNTTQQTEQTGAVPFDSIIQSFNKVWIVPDTAELLEFPSGVAIAQSRLKVMTESDYLAEGNRGDGLGNAKYSNPTPPSPIPDNQIKQIIHDVILPVIEEEINTSETFAPLRQIYNAILLACWYKQKLRNSPLGSGFAGRKLTDGLDGGSDIQAIYQAYLVAFRSGAADVISERYDPDLQTVTPIHYFTGGANFVDAAMRARSSPAGNNPLLPFLQENSVISEIRIHPDNAMLDISIDKIFGMVSELPLGAQIKSLTKTLNELKQENKPDKELAQFEHRLDQLRKSFRIKLEEQGYKTIIPFLKKNYYYDFIHALIPQNTFLITFRLFVENTLLPLLQETNKNLFMLAISGKAASGKTTLAKILLNIRHYVKYIQDFPWEVIMISYDDYMLEKGDRPHGENVNPESPFTKSQNQRFQTDVTNLKMGNAVWAPIYDQKAKGQLKAGTGTDNTLIIYNGNTRAEIRQIKENISITTFSPGVIAEKEEEKTITLYQNTPVKIKLGGLEFQAVFNREQLELTLPESRHTFESKPETNWFYTADGKESTLLSSEQKTELLRYIPRLEDGKKRLIVFEGFMTLTAAKDMDFTVNVETSSPIRIWRSIIREIIRGRSNLEFLRTHLHILLKRELSEDSIIDDLTKKARVLSSAKEEKSEKKSHYDIINYSVPEYIVSSFLKSGIPPGSRNILTRLHSSMEKIIADLPGIRNQALSEWLKKVLQNHNGQPWVAKITLPPFNSKNIKSGNYQWYNIPVNDDFLIGFYWDGNKDHPTVIPDILDEIHKRSRGPIAGFNVLDPNDKNQTMSVNIDGKNITIPIGRVFLMEHLPSISESLLKRQQKEKSERIKASDRVALKSPEEWIDQFLYVHFLLWQRGILDLEPSPTDYGIKNLEGKLVLQLGNLRGIRIDDDAKQAFTEIFSKKAKQKMNQFIRYHIFPAIKNKDLKQAINKLSPFQKLFICNPEKKENYLSMIPVQYHGYYIGKIGEQVPRNPREMFLIFGKVWKEALEKSVEKDLFSEYINQGIPAPEVYDEMIDFVSERFNDISLKTLNEQFEKIYKNMKQYPQDGQTPRQQFLQDFLLIQSENPFDYKFSTASVFLNALISNPEWLQSHLDKEEKPSNIRKSLEALLTQEKNENHIFRKKWEERLIEQVIKIVSEIPESWEKMAERNNPNAAMLKTAKTPGGVDLAQTAGIISSTGIGGGFSFTSRESNSFWPENSRINISVRSILPARNFSPSELFGLPETTVAAP